MNQLSLKDTVGKTLDITGRFSVKGDIFSIGGIPGNGSLRSTLEFLDAIWYYAPEVRLHPDDELRPSGIKWFLRRVIMRFHRENAADDAILPKGIEIDELINQRHRRQHSGSGPSSDFFLQIPNDSQETTTREGERNKFVNRQITNNVECYCHAREVKQYQNCWDFKYLFFYPYNGAPDIPVIHDTGAHEGDWEHITVRVNLGKPRSIPEGVYFSIHGEGCWAQIRTNSDPGNNFNKFRLNSAGQPIVFSAWHSHASYAGSGDKDRPFYKDKATNGGPIWNCRGKLIFLGELSAPNKGQEWINYTGRWGEIGTSYSGPYGPAFQDGGWWKDKEKDGPSP